MDVANGNDKELVEEDRRFIQHKNESIHV